VGEQFNSGTNEFHIEHVDLGGIGSEHDNGSTPAATPPVDAGVREFSENKKTNVNNNFDGRVVDDDQFGEFETTEDAKYRDCSKQFRSWYIFV
jgi:hypothetical protein